MTDPATIVIHDCPVVSGGVVIHREDCPQVPLHTHAAPAAEPVPLTLDAEALVAVHDEHLDGLRKPGKLLWHQCGDDCFREMAAALASSDKGEPRL